MSKIKSNNNTIDLSQYVTQAEYCRLYPNIKLGTLSQWIKRAKAGQSTPHNIEYLEVTELNMTLIKK